MNIDEKIKKELESEAVDLDRILQHEDAGLFSMLRNGLKGSMRIWFIVVNAVTIVVSMALLWCAYQFFTVASGEQLYWGVLFVVSLQAQIALKQWLFDEMRRSSLMREIKRIELSVAELGTKINS